MRAAVVDAILLGAHAPLHDRVDPLEVARVEREREVDLVVGAAVGAGERPVDRVAEVVLHVAARGRVLRRVLLVEELGEDLRRAAS